MNGQVVWNSGENNIDIKSFANTCNPLIRKSEVPMRTLFSEGGDLYTELGEIWGVSGDPPWSEL